MEDKGHLGKFVHAQRVDITLCVCKFLTEQHSISVCVIAGGNGA